MPDHLPAFLLGAAFGALTTLWAMGLREQQLLREGAQDKIGHPPWTREQP